VYDTGGIDHSYVFQFNWLFTQMVEQPDTTAKQDGYNINVDFVHKVRVEALLQDTRSTYNDIFIPRGFLSLTNGTFNAISDKGEWRSFLDPFLWNCMGNNKTGFPGGMATPAVGDIKGSPPSHARSICSECLLQDFGALR
jgi:hypothetical protein